MARYIQSYTYWNDTHTKLFQEGAYVVWDDNQNTETDAETEAKIEALFDSFSQDLKKKIEYKATELVEQTLTDYEYDSEGEVALYASNPDSRWNEEATALQKWIEATYAKMYQYQKFDVDSIPNEDAIVFEPFKGVS